MTVDCNATTNVLTTHSRTLLHINSSVVYLSG